MSPERTTSELIVSLERGDSYKLVSLMALATGAIAMPQTSNADIFYSDHVDSPFTVGYTASPSYTIDDLPGSAMLRFQFSQTGSSSFTSTRFVAFFQESGYVRLRTNAFFAAPAGAGMLWNQIPGNSAAVGSVGAANLYLRNPASYNDVYFAFRFRDSTQGNQLRYGWINVSLDNRPLATGEGPHLTIFGWAYDSTGAQIPMGMVPEPSSAAILALGALALGSKGVRSWRRNRATTEKS